MKKLIITSIIVIFTVYSLNAQFTKVGGGLAVSSGFTFHNMDFDYNKSGHFAAFVKGIYELSLPVHLSPSYTIFFPGITDFNENKTIVSSMMFDINGHYVFNSLDRFEFYGLAGLDIMFAWKKDKYPGADSEVFKERDNALGLNIGAGTYMKLTEQFDIFGELKYVISKYDQLILNVGVLINLDWLKKNENSIL